MNVKEYMMNYKRVTEIPFSSMHVMSIMRPYLVCNDGFSVSIQASENHYCEPRENLLDKDYEEVELGFPSEEDSLILDYAEDPDEPTNTVYGYVPIDVVQELINKHGGIKGPNPKSLESLKQHCDMYSYCTW